MQSEILESLEDKHVTTEVHINESASTLGFGVILLPIIISTVFHIDIQYTSDKGQV